MLELLAARLQQPGMAALLEAERAGEAERLVERARQALQQRHELHAMLAPHLRRLAGSTMEATGMELRLGAVRLALAVKCW